MRARRALRAAGWPMGGRLFGLAAGAITVMVWLGIRGQLGWRALDWAHTSAQFTAQLRLPGILAAVVASHVAVRLNQRTRIFAQPWAARVGHPLLLRHLGQLLGWFVPAYVIGMAPLLWATARQAGYGRPDILVILGALLGFVALVAFGYLIGLVIQNLLAVPMTAALAFLLLSLPNVADGWNAVVPTMSALPTLGREQSQPLSLYRLFAFTVFVASFYWVAVQVVTRRSVLRAAQAPLLLVPAVLVVFPLMRPPALLTYSAAGNEICDSRDGIVYCVHEGHRSELAPIQSLAAPVIAAYGPENADIRAVRDSALATSDADVPAGPQSGTLWVHITPGWKPAEEVPPLVAAALVKGQGSCVSPVGSMATGASADERRAYLLYNLSQWLEGQAFPQGGMRAGLFAGSTPQQVREWIARERQAIDTCTADPEKVPWR